MEFSLFTPAKTVVVVELFTHVFTASEGEAAGKTIGDLVGNLIRTTPTDELVGCLATVDSTLVGALFFSRMVVPSGQVTFILSPVAIAPPVQKNGIGQALIRYGLAQMQERDVELVFTYGDPAFYSKTGFKSISEDVVKAPYHLSQPVGWLAQSLTGDPIAAMDGVTKCVPALSDKKYW